MDPASGAVLLIDTKTQLSRAAESDLALAGFEVVSVADPRKLLETARGRTVAAIVMQGVTGGVWRRWKRDPDLHRVPVVVLAPGRPRQLPFPWPFGAFVRADAYVSGADLKRSGGVADAVRALVARGISVAPTDRERFGEALWHAGSVLYVVGALLAIGSIVITRSLAGILNGIPFLGTGIVLMDAGGRVGIGQRLRLEWQSWVWIVLVFFVARVLFTHR